MPKTFETDILIAGGIDPSLARATGFSIQQLQKIQRAAAVMNKEYSAAARQINGLTAPMKRFSAEVKVTESLVQRLGHSMKRIGEFAAGGLMARGFEAALGAVESIGEKIKEFTGESIHVSMEREILKNQIHAVTASMGKSAMAQQINDAIIDAEGVTTGRNYGELSESAAQLLSANPKRFGNTEAVVRMLNQLSDTSKDAESFKRGTYAISRMYAGGQVDAKHLQEFAADTGYNLTSAMIKAGGFKGKDELEAALGKKGIYHGEKSLDLLEKAMKILTGPGGAAFEHSIAQLHGWAGMLARAQASWTSFQQGFGDSLERFVVPLGSKILDYLKPSMLFHTFDGLHQLGNTLRDFGLSIIPAVATRFQMLFGAENSPFKAFMKLMSDQMVEVQDPVNGVHKVLRAGPLDRLNQSFTEMSQKAGELSEKIGVVLGKAVPLIEAFWKLHLAMAAFFEPIDKWVFGQAFPKMVDFFTQQLPDAISRAFGLIGGGDPKGLQGLKDEHEKMKEDLRRASGANPYGGNYGLHGDISGVRGEYYGKNFGEYNRDANYYGGKALGDNDIALSPDLQRKYALGSYVNAYDHGRFLGRYRVGDTSYKKPGQPNSGTVEFRDRKVDSNDISLVPVTINLHVQALDSHGFDRVLRENSDSLGRHVARALQDRFSAQAVV